MEKILCVETLALQQQCGSQVLIAVAYLMCHIVNVLVRRQLDIDTYSMHTSESGARPHAEKNDLCPETP